MVGFFLVNCSLVLFFLLSLRYWYVMVGSLVRVRVETRLNNGISFFQLGDLYSILLIPPVSSASFATGSLSALFIASAASTAPEVVAITRESSIETVVATIVLIIVSAPAVTATTSATAITSFTASAVVLISTAILSTLTLVSAVTSTVIVIVVTSAVIVASTAS